MDAHTLTPAAELAKKAKTPFPGESAEYRQAREALLAEEIEFRRHMTRLAEQRRALPPGPVVAKIYRFKDANRAGRPRRNCNPTLATYFDVRTATRASLPDLHQLSRCDERQRCRHQAARGAEDPRPLAGRASDCFCA